LALTNTTYRKITNHSYKKEIDNISLSSLFTTREARSEIVVEHVLRTHTTALIAVENISQKQSQTTDDQPPAVSVKAKRWHMNRSSPEFERLKEN